jgi:hypothetical protein
LQIEPRRRLSFVRHSGLSQSGEICGFVQGADFLDSEVSASLQAGDARIAVVAGEPPGFGQLGGRAFAIAFEGVGGGEPGVRLRM